MWRARRGAVLRATLCCQTTITVITAEAHQSLLPANWRLHFRHCSNRSAAAQHLVVREMFRLCGAFCWLLAVGCWLLAVGCWLLAVGCWLLAAGCWLLAVG